MLKPMHDLGHHEGRGAVDASFCSRVALTGLFHERVVRVLGKKQEETQSVRAQDCNNLGLQQAKMIQNSQTSNHEDVGNGNITRELPEAVADGEDECGNQKEQDLVTTSNPVVST